MPRHATLLLALLPTVLASLLVATVSSAATFNVAAGDVAGLVAAIDTANGNGEADTIELAAGTYTLTTGTLPAITSEITIVGPDAATTTIERAAVAPQFRLLAVNPDGKLRIEGVTLRRGRGGAFGGGLTNNGRLEVVSCTLTDNQATTGAAISSSGELEIEGSTVTGSSGVAISIVRASTATIRGSQLISNDGTAVDMADGGLLRIADSLIQSNSGQGVTGTDDFTYGSLFIEIVRSTIDANSSTGVSFGALYAASTARTVITESTISNNGGGGINLGEAELVLRRSTVSGNVTPLNGGGIFIQGAAVAPGGLSQVTIDSSTISGNGAALKGGGIFIADGLRLGRKLRIVRSTITGNVADADSNGSGDGGGIVTPTATVEIEDSILAGNVDNTGQAPDCAGPIASQGHNVVGDTTACGFFLASSDVVGPALLGALASNGGPTMTHLPLAGSPAIDAADPARCGDPDQRGFARPTAGCDAGAVEVGAASVVTYLSDHFLCYDAKTSRSTAALTTLPGVSAADDIESKDFDVKKSRALCTPADENGEGVLDEATHLHSREIKESSGQPRHLPQRNIRLATQLGMFSVDTLKPDRLLVPTAKGLVGPLPAPDPMSHDVDRFKCYKARPSAGAPKLPRGATSLDVILGNQFTRARSLTLSKLTRLCTSVDEEGLGRKNPASHLVCFQARTQKPLLLDDVEATFVGLYSTSEFGTEQLDTRRAYELCIPARRLP